MFQQRSKVVQEKSHEVIEVKRVHPVWSVSRSVSSFGFTAIHLLDHKIFKEQY